ncbi:hypothetical protein GO988_21640 [Hymenobacter sp. HMF4947]|uniref:Uncharacterized protein n=1 Tax=Hymenobacter ginkgonis TaxID=2682976 RepID=A0A7K1TLF1_9BACT|nr:hypothetical protein [Hymenobacter ginkgonis]MVN78941.1 hypothetical protein [Hymenobacter ginkgonis]
MDTLLSPTPTFTPDPYLPWLRTDPAMQSPEAFHAVETLTLGAQTWEPMGRHFPGGTTLALVRITSPEQLTEGVYWHQHTYYEPSRKQEYTRYAFARFAGLTSTCDERARARRLKRGQVHFELAADVLPDNLRRDYLLREDGTQTCYMDFNSFQHKLWRVTHYVNLPATLLATLAPQTALLAGTTAEQQRWLAEEKTILTHDAAEYTGRVLGGFPEPDCRAVLYREQMDDFNCLANSLTHLTPSQAKKRKSGAVAITWRCSTPFGTTGTLTQYFKREEADLLLGWLQSTTDYWRAEARLRQHRLAVASAAEAIRATRATYSPEGMPVTVAEQPQELAQAA